MLFWFICMEMNKRIFKNLREGGFAFDIFWDRVHFWASLWALISSAFRMACFWLFT